MGEPGYLIMLFLRHQRVAHAALGPRFIFLVLL